ncbi:MAG: hypothetical protein KJ064_08030 [Anaerolineae bacterium]|nr:hypothetical protein [Anaerolineae bacterium]
MTTVNNTTDSLHVLNPLEWWRLGWSLFVKPEKLAAIRVRDGDEQLRPIGTLLANLMLWMPFMVIALAFVFERLPYAAIEPVVYPGHWLWLIAALWIWTVMTKHKSNRPQQSTDNRLIDADGELKRPVRVPTVHDLSGMYADKRNMLSSR